MKITKTVMAVSSCALVATALVSCAANENAAAPTTAESAVVEDDAVGAVAANARPDECGLQEQAGPEAAFGPFDGAVHFFQPGQMAPNPGGMMMHGMKMHEMKMLDYKDSQMHLEFDLKANEFATNWGYSVDETPAALTLLYQLKNASGEVLSEGHMMEMNAIDGSHYGTNLPKDTIKEPGDYTLTVSIYPPSNYDLHQDYITGVPARGWFKPLTVAMPWKITQENLDIVAQNTVENFMEPSESCAAYPVKMYEDPAAEKAMKAAEDMTPLALHS